MGRVQDKVALVTGGASGLGAASVRRLAAEGAKVLFSDVQDELGEALAAELTEAGHDCFYQHQDVSREEAWEQVIDSCLQRFGRLDVLLNNAGIGGSMYPVHEMSLEQWRKVTSINLDGVFLGVKHGIKAMGGNPGGPAGSIINISSIAGIVGLPLASAYCASKAGVKLLTKTAALECAADKNNIRVNSIHPGFIETPLVLNGIEKTKGRMSEMIRKGQPGGEMGQPEDIAHMVLYLASDESKFVNGAEMVVDGAYSAR